MNIKTFVFNTFALAALFSLPSLAHASITPSLSPSRTTGVAPLSVFFDASGTTSTATILPFHEIDYSWNFGDDDSTTWTYGARPGVNKKNRAYGPVAAHVFETPGTYTVTLSVYDGTDTATTTEVITVTDPDTVFSGTNTVCFSTSGTFTDCPGGASTVTDATGDFDAAIAANLGTGKRLLFNRGETWSTSTNALLDVDGPWTIGAYGTGAKPIVLWTAGAAILQFGANGSNSYNDMRVMDLVLDPGLVWATPFAQVAATFKGKVDQVTFLRMDMPGGLVQDVVNTAGLTGAWDQMTVVDSTVAPLAGGIDTAGGSFIATGHLAIMGCLYDNNGDSEHNLRTMYMDKMVISHNTFTRPHVGKANLTLRGSPWVSEGGPIPSGTWNEYAVISDNKFIGGSGLTGPMVNTSVDSAHIAMTRYILFERNIWTNQVSSQSALSLNSSYSTIRNNIFDFSADAGGNPVAVSNNTYPLPPVGNAIYNNTIYANQAGASLFFGIRLFCGSTDTMVKNNLVYAPSSSGVTVVNEFCGTTPAPTGTVGASGTHGNSSDNQGRLTNPLFLNASGTFSQPGDFIPTTGSYALASGTTVPVYRDFYNNLRGATMDMGAFKQDSDPNDTTPPILSSITANVTSDTTATITWTTNEFADSTVNYGTTGAYGQTSTSASNTTSHTRNLTSLTPGTIYHFEVLSTDPSTNTTTSADQTFTTTGINPVIAPSRTTGVAPLSVFFDASGTTASSTTLPFHELDYSWNFGDDDTATWTYGTRPGVNKKNRAYGPESAHVFETPGTYTVTLSVYDGTDTVTTTQEIIVTDPDTVFAGANTVCVNNVGDSDFTGCPSGAVTQNTNDYITAQGYITGSVRRLLFKAGGTWTKITTTAMSAAGPGLIGAYGSGAKPIILGDLKLRVTSSDWRVMNLQIDCQNVVASYAIFPPSGSQQLYYKLDIINCGSAIDAGGAGTEGIDQLFFVDSTYHNGSVINGEQVAMMGPRQVAMGNSIDGNMLSYHALRVHHADRGVFSHNYFAGTNSSVETASLRAPNYDRVTGSPHPVTQHVVFSDNEISANGYSALSVKTATDINGHIENVIIENNYIDIPDGSVAGSGIGVVTGSNISIRNNIVDISQNDSGKVGITVDWLFTNPPKPDYVWVYNNSIYDSENYPNFRGVAAGINPTHVVIKNNLAYAPNAGTNQIMVSDTGSVGLLESNNSTDSQVKNTNPFPVPTPTSLSDFIPTSGSYAIASGTSVPVYRDFYNNLRGATMDMGAFNLDSIPEDTIPPTVTSVNSDKGDGTYGIGEVIDIDISFSEAVTSTGNIIITLETGATDRTCTFTVSNSDTGTCNYTVQSGDTTGDLSVSSIAGTINDQSANPMTDFVPGIALETNKAFIIDTTPPTLTESSAIATSTDTTPDYTFSTTEGGALTYGGDCTSSTTTATSGSNTITFSTLSAGTHTNCTLTVTDASSNASTPLAITSFTITEETIATPEVAGTSSSSKSKPKKKKISGSITYQKGERIAPWITLLTPTSNTSTNKKFTIKATSKDKSGIQAMFVSINGIKKKRMNTDSILYTAKKRQNASITVSAYDKLGNVKIAQITITDGKVSGVRYY